VGAGREESRGSPEAARLHYRECFRFCHAKCVPVLNPGWMSPEIRVVGTGASGIVVRERRFWLLRFRPVACSSAGLSVK
jgi:hypothetical protein